ncbi:MAG: ABC transporter permease [Chloroflexi bacterium RBG_13_50_21]|nr:MAG: ABC transporter permease [Chloroflexi bacterium RBG_13_50_21]
MNSAIVKTRIRIPRLKLRQREAILFYLCISPWLIGFVLFYLGPILASFYYSLTEWDLLTSPEFVGMDNYVRLFTRDPLALKAFKVTLVYTLIYVPLDLVFGLSLALLLNQKIRGIGVFRTVYYLPSVLSGVAYVVMWMWMFNPQHGLINTLLAYAGIQGPRWLLDPKWALSALIVMSLWGVGRSMVIFLAGLQDIPIVLYEAAEIDGATRWKKLWNVTLPLLTPSLLFNLIFGIILTFQTFTNAFVATNGGPLDSTLFYVLYLYRKAFEHLQMGYASAMAWVLFLIVLGCTLLIFLTSGKWVFYRSVGE